VTAPGLRIVRIYTGADGESHFEEGRIPMRPRDAECDETAWIAAREGALFRRTSGERYMKPHNAPRRQLLIMLGGAMEVGVASGETKTLAAGDILLAEDTEGSGHTTRDIAGRGQRVCVVVALGDDVDTSAWLERNSDG
jgi:hypothetical protein